MVCNGLETEYGNMLQMISVSERVKSCIISSTTWKWFSALTARGRIGSVISFWWRDIFHWDWVFNTKISGLQRRKQTCLENLLLTVTPTDQLLMSMYTEVTQTPCRKHKHGFNKPRTSHIINMSGDNKCSLGLADGLRDHIARYPCERHSELNAKEQPKAMACKLPKQQTSLFRIQGKDFKPLEN